MKQVCENENYLVANKWREWRRRKTKKKCSKLV